MKELRGKPVAEALTEQLKVQISQLEEEGITPTLGIIRVGNRPDDLAYEKGAKERFAEVGADVRVRTLYEDCSQMELERAVTALNNDPSVDGVLLLRPLPKHLSEARVQHLMKPEKDVDCFGEGSYAALLSGSKTSCPPCTPAAVMELLEYYGIDLTGKKVTLVGRSMVVGKPLMLLLMAKNATVTVCHTRTVDLQKECRDADIVISCIGSAKMLNEEYVRPGQIVIDVGINTDRNGKLCGDVDFNSVAPVVDSITPVPRGVGSVTTAVLLKHVIACARGDFSNL